MDQRILAAMHENFVVALARVGALSPGAATATLPPWRLIDANVGFDTFNVAVPTARATDPGRATQDAAGWFEARQAPFRFVLRDDVDEALAAAAETAGFARYHEEPAMLLDALPRRSQVPRGLNLTQVGTPESAADWARVEDGEFESRRAMALGAAAHPGFALFVGRVDGVPVARSMAVVTETVVGVYSVYVAPPHHGTGLGRALTAAAIDAGRAAGCTAACLQSSPMGLPLYEGMGFRTAYRYVSLRRPG